MLKVTDCCESPQQSPGFVSSQNGKFSNNPGFNSCCSENNNVSAQRLKNNSGNGVVANDALGQFQLNGLEVDYRNNGTGAVKSDVMMTTTNGDILKKGSQGGGDEWDDASSADGVGVTPSNNVTLSENSCNNVRNRICGSVLLAKDTKPLGYQVAGHDRTGVLKHELGYVLKPLQKEPLGTREVEFYKAIYDDQGPGNPYHRVVRKFTPYFYGLVELKGKEEQCEPYRKYLALEDAGEGFEKPCVVDIKIGAQTWDPEATPEKIANEKSKYIGTKMSMGLSLTGLQYFDIKHQSLKKMPQDLGKTFNRNTFISALEEFFNAETDPEILKLIAAEVLRRLQSLKKEYFEVQRDFKYYSSSLLIAYDAEGFSSLVEGGDNSVHQEECYEDNGKKRKLSREAFSSCEISKFVRVWMIDFAHVIPMKPNEKSPDRNYLYGLNTLIEIISGFL